MIGLVEAKVRATTRLWRQWPHAQLLPRIPSAPGWARFKMTAGKRLEYCQRSSAVCSAQEQDCSCQVAHHSTRQARGTSYCEGVALYCKRGCSSVV